jgi:uncharacterized membrane protein
MGLCIYPDPVCSWWPDPDSVQNRPDQQHYAMWSEMSKSLENILKFRKEIQVVDTGSKTWVVSRQAFKREMHSNIHLSQTLSPGS